MPAGGANLTPREIVSELDRYIVGQRAAKRAVAIALRNRWRRQNLPAELRDEVAPKNIIMIGPTGVGKTEISRRLAKLAQAPFIKVEASKYTEVGYVGRDVESMVRELTELGVTMVKAELMAEVRDKAERLAEPALQLRRGRAHDDIGDAAGADYGLAAGFHEVDRAVAIHSHTGGPVEACVDGQLAVDERRAETVDAESSGEHQGLAAGPCGVGCSRSQSRAIGG